MGSNSHISFEQSRQFNKLILDYINGSESLKEFYVHEPVIESYKNVIDQKNFDDRIRPVLVETLTRQYSDAAINLNKDKAVADNINKLLKPNTFTITTGHQLCLYTGPLYFIYKILTTIKWCEELQKAYPENNFVPVFWMASEDHDFAEINHLFINKEKVTWDIDSREQPVGRLPIVDFDKVASEILNKAENDFARKQIEILNSFYSSSKTLSEATRKLVHHLFKDKGLVIIDADEKKLKEVFIPYIKKDVLEQSNFTAIQYTNSELRKEYKTQVNGREINFFYLSDNGRKLIKQNNDGYIVEGTEIRFSKDEIEKEIDTNPEKFSPNVILRPLYQELVLPNLSYVGGPGEIAYWLQLKSVFENNLVSFPVLTLRNFLLLVKEQHANALKRIGLDIEDLFEEQINNERKLVERNHDGGQKIIVNEFDKYLQDLIDIAQKTDTKISSDLIAYKTEWKKKLLALSSDLDKKQRLKITDNSTKLQKIKSAYFNGTVMQERFENILSYGITQDISFLISYIHPFIEIDGKGIKTITIQG